MKKGVHQSLFLILGDRGPVGIVVPGWRVELWEEKLRLLKNIWWEINHTCIYKMHFSFKKKIWKLKPESYTPDG